jgi:transposase
VVERTLVKNQLHAEQTEAEPNANTLKRLKKRIALLDRQEEEIKEEIKGMEKQDQEEYKENHPMSAMVAA